MIIEQQQKNTQLEKQEINNNKKKHKKQIKKLFQILQTGRREQRQYNKRRATRQWDTYCLATNIQLGKLEHRLVF